MEILLDNRSAKIKAGDAENLEEILAWIMTDQIKPNQAIAAVKLNGEVYSEKRPHDALGIPVSAIKTLEIDTVNTEEIGRHFLENGALQLDSIIQGALKISEYFRIADEQEANEQYMDFLESIHLFLKMFTEVKHVFNLNLDLIVCKNGCAEERLVKLAAMLDELIKAQEQEDWIMLADLLEYELAPLLEEFKLILPILREHGSDL